MYDRTPPFCIHIPIPPSVFNSNLTRHVTSHNRHPQTPQSSQAPPSPSTPSAAPTTAAQPAPTAASATAAASLATVAAAPRTAATGARLTTAPAGSPRRTHGPISAATRTTPTRAPSTPPSSSREIQCPSVRPRAAARDLPSRVSSTDRSAFAGPRFLMAGCPLQPGELVTSHAQVTPRRSAADPMHSTCTRSSPCGRASGATQIAR
jgi:hypothetical protein